MTEQQTGASAEALGFLVRLERWAATDVTTGLAAARAALLAFLRAEQAAHAANGLVHQLAARALDVAAADGGDDAPVAGLRTRLAQSCAAERADLEGACAAVARTATALVTQRGAWLATLGGGSTVSLALRELQRLDRGPRALVAEGRPLLGGRAVAAELGRAGVPTWLVVDAALPMLLSQAGGLWLGAGAVTERGAIVAVGGYAAALAAREHSVPVHVLATRRRFLPAATAALRIEEMPAGEVWDAPPPGVRPRNVHADLLPLELVRGVVVEDEVLGPTETAAVARERALPEALAGPTAR
jgi:translation initiation factor 2B subunit (eIF-2B alpha/beta/delta family)